MSQTSSQNLILVTLVFALFLLVIPELASAQSPLFERDRSRTREKINEMSSVKVDLFTDDEDGDNFAVVNQPGQNLIQVSTPQVTPTPTPTPTATPEPTTPSFFSNTRVTPTFPTTGISTRPAFSPFFGDSETSKSDSDEKESYKEEVSQDGKHIEVSYKKTTSSQESSTTYKSTPKEPLPLFGFPRNISRSVSGLLGRIF